MDQVGRSRQVASRVLRPIDLLLPILLLFRITANCSKWRNLLSLRLVELETSQGDFLHLQVFMHMFAHQHIGGTSSLRYLQKETLLVKLFFLKNILFIYFQRGEGRGKERERNISVWLPLVCRPLGTWPATQACVLTGNQTSGPFAVWCSVQ